MAYIPGPSVTITNPVTASVVVQALSAWFGNKSEPPGEVRLLLRELHWVATGTGPAKPIETYGTAPQGGSPSMDVMTASRILVVSEPMVRRYCADGTLLAAKAHGSWAIDADSLADLAAERGLKSAC